MIMKIKLNTEMFKFICFLSVKQNKSRMAENFVTRSSILLKRFVLLISSLALWMKGFLRTELKPFQ